MLTKRICHSFDFVSQKFVSHKKNHNRFSILQKFDSSRLYKECLYPDLNNFFELERKEASQF